MATLTSCQEAQGFYGLRKIAVTTIDDVTHDVANVTVVSCGVRNMIMPTFKRLT